MSDRQSVLGRVGQLAKVSINALLDQAEDPQQALDQLIREYTSNIAEAERTAAATIGELRLMEQDRHEDLVAAKEWGDQALAASRRADVLRADGSADEADRFDRLAKVALGRELQAEKEARTAEPTIAAQTGVVERLQSGLEQMRSRLAELASKRDELESRATSAAQTPIPAPSLTADAAASASASASAVKSISVLDPTGEISRFEDKMRREEARARGTHELEASSLDAQFEQLDAFDDTAEVAARLAALKATT
ncbi:PspA/IM30 family protein [Streptomyces sp. BR1]|uniref:PspA/IM30 family protein n=1 Tax=Streptomyces sp. BR1 TaxID=1592323 RepID=UPI00402B5E04